MSDHDCREHQDTRYDHLDELPPMPHEKMFTPRGRYDDGARPPIWDYVAVKDWNELSQEFVAAAGRIGELERFAQAVLQEDEAYRRSSFGNQEFRRAVVKAAQRVLGPAPFDPHA